MLVDCTTCVCGSKICSTPAACSASEPAPQQLEAQLLELLQERCGERGISESAVDTLRRIIAERDDLEVAVFSAYTIFDSADLGQWQDDADNWLDSYSRWTEGKTARSHSADQEALRQVNRVVERIRKLQKPPLTLLEAAARICRMLESAPPEDIDR